MTPLAFSSYVRWKTRTNASTFTDTDMLMLLNLFKDDISLEIIKANEDYFGTPETANLVFDAVNNVPQRQYPLPTDMLNQIKHVEAQLDGINWVSLKEMDLAGFRGTTDETRILQRFDNTEGNAYFDIFSNSLWLYTGTFGNVTNGLKLWTFQWAADMTNLAATTDMSIDPTNTSSGFPRAFHELLARRVIIEYKTSLDKPMQLNEHELKYDADLRSKIDSITDMNEDRSAQATVPGVRNPEDTQYDNGYNL